MRQVEEAHLAESMERLIMEAYKLLQQGDMPQAESLLQEGARHHVRPMRISGGVCRRRAGGRWQMGRKRHH